MSRRKAALRKMKKESYPYNFIAKRKKFCWQKVKGENRWRQKNKDNSLS